MRCSRLARRGGIKRISAGIYDETREVLRKRLEEVYVIPWLSTVASNGLQLDSKGLLCAYGAQGAEE